MFKYRVLDPRKKTKSRYKKIEDKRGKRRRTRKRKQKCDVVILYNDMPQQRKTKETTGRQNYLSFLSFRDKVKTMFNFQTINGIDMRMYTKSIFQLSFAAAFLAGALLWYRTGCHLWCSLR